MIPPYPWPPRGQKKPPLINEEEIFTRNAEWGIPRSRDGQECNGCHNRHTYGITNKRRKSTQKIQTAANLVNTKTCIDTIRNIHMVRHTDTDTLHSRIQHQSRHQQLVWHPQVTRLERWVISFALNISLESASLITCGRLFHRQGTQQTNALCPADIFLTFGSKRRPAPEDRRG